MPLTVYYTGIEESFPARLGITAVEAYSLGTAGNPGGGFYDLCGLYLKVLSDLASGGEETVAVDLSQAPGGLTEGEKAAVAWRFRELCGTGLADPESAAPGDTLFTIRAADGAEEETYSLPVLRFDAARSRIPAASGVGLPAEGCLLRDCFAVWPEFGTWSGYQVGEEILYQAGEEIPVSG